MTTKKALLDQLDAAARDWDELASKAVQANPTRSGAMGDWSFVDVAGHLNGWRAWSVARLEAAVNGAASAPPPWPAELNEATDDGVDAINTWIYAHNHERPLADILAEAQDQWRRLRVAAQALPEADLVTPGRYSWLGGYALGEVINGAASHLHDEHEADIRHWLSAHDG